MSNNLEKIRCIAVDDEPIALSIVQNHCLNIPWLELDGIFTSATKAVEHLRKHVVDLVFLDINMPDLSGLEMAGMIERSVNIIFTTAYSEHAVDGFEIGAADYLLKPISFERFLKACERVRALRNTSQYDESRSRDAIFFKDGYHWIRIKIPDLIYLEASDNYVLFHGKEKPVMVRITLSDAMNRLTEKGFRRIHKSYGVALSKIEKVETTSVIAAGHKIPLSSAYKTELLKALE